MNIFVFTFIFTLYYLYIVCKIAKKQIPVKTMKSAEESSIVNVRWQTIDTARYITKQIEDKNDVISNKNLFYKIICYLK